MTTADTAIPVAIYTAILRTGRMPDQLMIKTGAFNLAFFLGAAAVSERSSGKLGCAGAQRGLYTAISLRFERRLVA